LLGTSSRSIRRSCVAFGLLERALVAPFDRFRSEHFSGLDGVAGSTPCRLLRRARTTGSPPTGSGTGARPATRSAVVGVRGQLRPSTGALRFRLAVDLIEFKLAATGVELFQVAALYLFIGA
jgi:hypothetical protein